jgi:hypothetical protein
MKEIFQGILKKKKTQCEVAEDASEPDMALSQSKLFLKL